MAPIKLQSSPTQFQIFKCDGFCQSFLSLVCVDACVCLGVKHWRTNRNRCTQRLVILRVQFYPDRVLKQDSLSDLLYGSVARSKNWTE